MCPPTVKSFADRPRRRLKCIRRLVRGPRRLANHTFLAACPPIVVGVTLLASQEVQSWVEYNYPLFLILGPILLFVPLATQLVLRSCLKDHPAFNRHGSRVLLWQPLGIMLPVGMALFFIAGPAASRLASLVPGLSEVTLYSEIVPTIQARGGVGSGKFHATAHGVGNPFSFHFDHVYIQYAGPEPVPTIRVEVEKLMFSEKYFLPASAVSKESLLSWVSRGGFPSETSQQLSANAWEFLERCRLRQHLPRMKYRDWTSPPWDFVYEATSEGHVAFLLAFWIPLTLILSRILVLRSSARRFR
jgi:hypothetical protein